VASRIQQDGEIVYDAEAQQAPAQAIPAQSR
jgi:hypothetical protein